MSRSRTWKTCWKTKGTQGEIGGLNKFLLLSPTPNNEYLYLQCSTWNDQGAAGDPGVLQSQSQPDGVQWRVSESLGVCLIRGRGAGGFSLQFSSQLNRSQQAVSTPPPRLGSLQTQ